MTAEPYRIRRKRPGEALEAVEDWVAVESPLEIRVEGHSIAIVMRTPGHDRELAAGFLFSEGVLTGPDDIFEISTCPASTDTGGNVVDVVLRNPDKLDLAKLTRHVFTNSSCGICGKATIAAALQSAPPLPTQPPLPDLDLLCALPAIQRENQPTFQSTGGLHASALFDLSGNLLCLHEDVGRHNALDKVIGQSVLENKLPLANTILLLSGRVSFELMQKALAAGIPTVVAVGAPSSLAVDFARTSGQNLVGFVRDGRANIYAPV
jgi:FdhD protein